MVHIWDPYPIFPQVYINNEYDTSTMASLDNSDEDEDEAEDEEEDDDEDEDDDEEDKEEVKEKMVFSSSAGERMLISISGDRCASTLFGPFLFFHDIFFSPFKIFFSFVEIFPLLDNDA